MKLISISKQAGFTLIELLAVIIIMAVLGFSLFIKWPGTSLNVNAQAQLLANDLRYTQTLAMTKGERYRLVILSSTTYQIVNASGTAILNAGGATTTTLNAGITIGTLTNLPNNLIAFDGQGQPYTTSSSPGTALSATASIPISGGENSKTISISPETGRVVVQ